MAQPICAIYVCHVLILYTVIVKKASNACNSTSTLFSKDDFSRHNKPCCAQRLHLLYILRCSVEILSKRETFLRKFSSFILFLRSGVSMPMSPRWHNNWPTVTPRLDWVKLDSHHGTAFAPHSHFTRRTNNKVHLTFTYWKCVITFATEDSCCAEKAMMEIKCISVSLHVLAIEKNILLTLYAI